MNIKKLNDCEYILKLHFGDEVMSSLKEFHKTVNNKFCKVTGIGALTDILVSYASKDNDGKVNYIDKEFNDEYEVLNCNGNISLYEDKSLPHIHLAFSDENYNTYGGHLKKATCCVTLELFITTFDKVINRRYDEETGLGLLDI